MYRDLHVTCVVPAYNEEKLIATTVKTLPPFIDRIMLINDGSTDATLERMQELQQQDQRIVILDNQPNRGLGASLVRAYKEILQADTDLVCVVPGDAQHDPQSIGEMFDALLDKQLDYVKPNRFMNPTALKQMPRLRHAGNVVISILTKICYRLLHNFRFTKRFWRIRPRISGACSP